jgi:hypothetical protein
MLVWTAERRTELAGLWLQGLGGKEIAKRLGATPSSVSTRAGRMGLPDAREMKRDGIVGTMRSCMCCRLPFYSLGKFNRICFDCKQIEQD